ncbi:MAG: calcium-binding protein [Methylovulum sp.]|nr:calcium-binding protein [Methylovulum sp.]
MATFKFTSGADNWPGISGDNNSGNDIVDALGGDDILDGGKGNDKLLGNTGNDLIAGGAGNDTLSGGDGDDVLDGGINSGLLSGDAGNDLIYGGTSLDTLNGGSGNDYLYGGADNDKLYGGAGSDALDGGNGNDTLSDGDSITSYGTTSTDHDEMLGGLGNDLFYGGYDIMWGGDGNDTFTAKNQATIYGGTGTDIITLSNANVKLGSWLDGGLGNDSIKAGSGNDTLISGYGKDTLIGSAGSDSYVITFDNFYDSTGNPDAGADTIIESANDVGTDTIYFIRDFAGDGRDDDKDEAGKELDPASTTIDYTVTMPENIENAVLDDQIYVNTPDGITYFVAWLTGNSKPNNIKGSGLTEVLDGAAGNDVINAGDGNDIIFAGQGKDVIRGDAGNDLVASRVNFNLVTDSTSIENIDLLDYSTAISATGNNFNNTLTGNKFNNKLGGGDGNDILDGWFYATSKHLTVSYAFSTDTLKTTGVDTLTGGSGDDLYRIDSTEDKVIEAASTGGIDTVNFAGAVATTVYILPAGVENLLMTSNLTEGDGNNLNNRITGGSTANILNGGYGDDYLDGGSGVDTFLGGYGDDTFVIDNLSEIITEKEGQGDDWVQSANITLDLNTSNWGGSVENARLTGTTSLLSVIGTAASNDLIGNGGNNTLNGGGGIDTLEGGLGDDMYYVDTTTDKLVEVANSTDSTTGKIKTGWVDTIQSSVNFTLAALLNFENLSLTGATAKTATGNSNDNAIIGNDLANTLSGLDGNDILDGAGGLDTLIGGKGNDIYRLANDGDIITELTGATEGTDTIEIPDTTFSLSLPSLKNNVENLTLTGTLTANGTGTGGANVITGNSAINTLTGLAGNDTLKGGEGADTLVGGLGADTLDLTESLASKDVLQFASGDSPASTVEADKVIKFALFYDTVDLTSTKIAVNVVSANGSDINSIKSHNISNGIIKFDDTDSYAAPLSISTTTLGDAIAYLKANITNGSTVAFQVSTDMWIFQDNGSNDTLIDLQLVGVATSLSTGGFSSTAIHIA